MTAVSRPARADCLRMRPASSCRPRTGVVELVWPTGSYLNVLKHLFLCLALGGVVAAETELDSLLWKRRVIVIASPSRNTQAFLTQRQELRVADAGWKERDLVLLEVIGSEKADLRRALKLKAADFSVLLIGKDGGVKLRSGTPVPLRESFELIDSMPMRQQEVSPKTSSRASRKPVGVRRTPGPGTNPQSACGVDGDPTEAN